jgi:nicotinamidase/pyrazinamidase
VADTVGAQLHSDLHVVEDAVMIKKGVGGEDGYSAFHVRDPVDGVTESTGLARLLGGVDRIIVMGLALDYCVKETALDACRLVATSVVADATRAVNLRPGDGARAVAELVSAGVTIL